MKEFSEKVLKVIKKFFRTAKDGKIYGALGTFLLGGMFLGGGKIVEGIICLGITTLIVNTVVPFIKWKPKMPSRSDDDDDDFDFDDEDFA